VEQHCNPGNLRKRRRGRSVVVVLGRICDATANMHNSADTMLAASQAVERAAESLRGCVDGFLRKIAS